MKKNNIIYQCQFYKYETVQTVCKHFGFEQGTLTGRSFVEKYDFSLVNKLSCSNITNNIENCKSKQSVKFLLIFFFFSIFKDKNFPCFYKGM